MKTAFGSAENAGAYHVFMDMLERIEKDKPRAYHRLMADLYQETLYVFFAVAICGLTIHCSQDVAGGTVSNNRGRDHLAVLDIDGMDE